ncbi:hypothetical protein HFP51_02055 [Parasphingopyxis sp. CP4]|uniref:hypothetical protein n=1 Tax=Parasphingopyxis sp. CP4 TaxID=2724527 RepID=UPI00159FB6FF|nr:hypothetical protein [Parasphingopyxis sp. CP4]QLC21075.1 hypothetical protein HFP51_02055 [Parasphingopyxis sp. CP4]
MTAEPQMIDPALDRALSASRDPVVPAGLTTRIAAQAVAQPQRKISGPFQAWRTRRTNKSRRTRRPVVFGVIGGGLMAASAVAAAWVSDGTFEIARITKPVVELFTPAAPQETAAAPAAPVTPRPASIAVDGAPGADAPRERATWIDRPFVRAGLIRQRIERIRTRRALAGVTPVVNRPLERRIIRRSLSQPGRRLTETQRARIRERIQAMPPEQRQQRIEEIRQRRAVTPPAARERAIEARRARIQQRMRERGANPPPPALQSTNRPPARPMAAPPVDAPPTATPVAIEGPVPDAPVTRRSITIEDSGPGPEPMQMPEARPNMSAADTPATAAARRAAIQARIQAARAAQRARAAGRNPPQRPPRPRIPRPRR